jgi:hypothetical protein
MSQGANQDYKEENQRQPKEAASKIIVGIVGT